MNLIIKSILFLISLVVITMAIVGSVMYYIDTRPDIEISKPTDYALDCIRGIVIGKIVEYNTFTDPNEAKIFLIDRGFVPPRNLTTGQIDVYLYENKSTGLKESRVCVDGEGI